MKTNPYLPIAVHGLLFTALTGSLYAIPTSINGNMSFSGSATTDNSSLLSATKFLSFQELSVGSPSTVSGDYAGTSGATVTMTPFTWNPAGASTPINPLWSFISSGITYSFNLTSLHMDFVSSTALVLSGIGTAFITGPGTDKLPTTGLWNFTGQTLGVSSFTFSSSADVAAKQNLPDGGTTVALLGCGMLGLSLLRRKVSA